MHAVFGRLLPRLLRCALDLFVCPLRYAGVDMVGRQVLCGVRDG